jgi:subtilase family serine protease
VNRIQASKILVFVTFSLFIIAYFVPIGTLLAALPEDDWVAYPMHISPFAGSPTPQGYSPSQIRTAYNLPSSGGAGTTIAIIDAFDTPNILNYFNAFSSQYGLPDNSTGNFLVHKMAQNIITESDWALETCLDVEWAHAIAPDAKILLVEAVSAAGNNLIAALFQA